MKKLAIGKLLIAVLLMTPISVSAQLKVTDLRVEHMKNPSTVDVEKPRLSWINRPSSADAHGERQKAYRIRVATSKEILLSGKADVWDSKKQKSAESYLVSYDGPALKSGQDYWWQVMTWDQKGRKSAWSEPAHWGMGLLNADDWKATWIGAGDIKTAPLFRKTFNVNNKIKQAKIFITGLGYFEFYINGGRIGDDYLVPNLTNYTKRYDIKERYISIDDNFRDYRVLYLAYDVTDNLQLGGNAIGVVLGNGFYNCTSHWVSKFGDPCLLAQLQIIYEDGTQETIVSDYSWKVSPSAIIVNGPYDGELYDAQKEHPGWATATYDETGWTPAQPVTKPIGKLTAHTSPTDKITEELKPISFKQLEDGKYEVDFGKEISGWIRINDMVGNAGDTLDIKYICESKLGIHRYIFANNQPISYAPRFTWYVFSKAIISGVKDLKAEQLVAEAVNTDVPIDATFSSSNPLLNKINEIWLRSQTDNMHGCIASDCPHRERSPYTGDGQVASAMVMTNYDAAAFYQKWIRDMNDAQNKETGYVPNGAPWQPGCGGGVPWGAAMNVMPWEYYMNYGDIQMLKNNFEAMRMQADQMLQWLTPDSTMLQHKSNFGQTEEFYWLNLGDWLPPYNLIPNELVHTFYLWLCMHNTALAAHALGDKANETHYSSIAERTKRAFHKKFYDEEKKTYGDFGANVLALEMGVPIEREAEVIASLRKEIMENHDGHLHTGIIGTRFLFEVLARYGLNDVAMTILNKRDFPSYGWWIEQGATVTWENWNGNDSHNHPMFGGGLVWFARDLCGVKLDSERPGYQHFTVCPTPTNSDISACYTKETPYGTLKSAVTHQQNQPSSYEITVPVGSSATLLIPATDEQQYKSSLKKYNLKSFFLPGKQLISVELPQGSYLIR